MKIRLYADETVSIRLDDIVRNMNRLAEHIHCELGTSRFSVADAEIRNPQTYRSLDPALTREMATDDLAIMFTNKPYDNNYFWEFSGRTAIVSLFAWDHLTNLSRNNGAVFFICALIVRCMRIGKSHRAKNIGCINDFWMDKTGVDTGMRSAFVCPACLDGKSTKDHPHVLIIKDVQRALDDLSRASRSNIDLCDFWCSHQTPSQFDVFLSYHSADVATVRRLNAQLRAAGINTWLDEEQLRPGRAWQTLLEEQIEIVKTAAILVGASGMGPWHQVEMRAFLSELIKRQCPVIPVILSDCQSVPKLPLFLQQLTWVDLRKSDPDPMERLLWGITGIRR